MKTTNNDQFTPIHPGGILREELLIPLGISSEQLALALGVPVTRINDLINEHLGIPALE